MTLLQAKNSVADSQIQDLMRYLSSCRLMW